MGDEWVAKRVLGGGTTFRLIFGPEIDFLITKARE